MWRASSSTHSTKATSPITFSPFDSRPGTGDDNKTELLELISAVQANRSSFACDTARHVGDFQTGGWSLLCFSCRASRPPGGTERHRSNVESIVSPPHCGYRTLTVVRPDRMKRNRSAGRCHQWPRSQKPLVQPHGLVHGGCRPTRPTTSARCGPSGDVTASRFGAAVGDGLGRDTDPGMHDHHPHTEVGAVTNTLPHTSSG